MGNKNLRKAKRNKNDEFYTRIEDIERELFFYRDQLKGKVIFCNCDDPEESNFWKYFYLNFKHLGLKKLISTHYDPDNPTYKLEYDGENIVKIELEQNGDFRSPESIEILKESDMVITNPPFSCYSNDTEVKTDNGWKLFKDVDIDNDLILSVNPETKNIEYVRAIDSFEHKFSGEMFNFKNRQMDLLVTPNHHMYAEYRKNDGSCALMMDKHGKLPLAEELKKSHLLPVSGFNYNNENSTKIILPSVKQKEQYSRREIIIPEKEVDLKSWLEFLGFYIADGSYRDRLNTLGNKDYSISIKQSEDNEEYVMDLFKKIGFNARINRNKGKRNHNYVVYSKQLWSVLSEFGRSDEKFFPNEYLDLAPEYLKCLLKGYTNGDSHMDKNMITYSSRSKVLMEDIQEIVLKVYGYITQVNKVVTKYRNKPYIYYELKFVMNRCHKNYTKYGDPLKIEYDNNVYCLQLERNHVMLVRRNGTISWSGNCFRDYVAQLVEHDKKFLIMGNNNAITYKEIFPLIKDNKMWLGYDANKTMEFQLSDDYEKWDRIDEKGKKYGKVPAISWFTNMDVDIRNQELKLHKTYNPEEYPKYDNYEAINVDRVVDIPVDFYDVIGVPITFLTKHNPNQFKIIGLGTSREHYTPNKQYEGLKTISKAGKTSGGAPINSTLAIKINKAPINKKYYKDVNNNLYLQPYARILIRRIKSNKNLLKISA